LIIIITRSRLNIYYHLVNKDFHMR